MDTPLINLSELSAEELAAFVKELGLPAFRGKQISGWLSQGATFDEMTNLPIETRKLLAAKATTGALRIAGKLQSAIDGTIKYLFDLGDGNLIESVLMKYKYGYSVCVSTQAGCRMGCTFCASAKAGFVRNLTGGEILAQLRAICKDQKISISHIVMMGVGEPLDNYDNVLDFIRMAHDPAGMNISYRKMSLSTCGVVPGIERLMEENIPLTLSVSLHAPFQEQRAEMMPVARKYKLDKLLEICNTYTVRTGRRITFEYAMIRDVNDSPKHADELIRLLGSMLCHVNLIPVNTVDGTGYHKAERERIDAFRKRLEDGGVAATVRRAMGRDIEAACGQLRRKAMEIQSGGKATDGDLCEK